MGERATLTSHASAAEVERAQRRWRRRAAGVVLLVGAGVLVGVPGPAPNAGALGTARAASVAPGPVDSGQLLLVNEGNRMRRIDVDSIGSGRLVEDVFIERAASGLPDARDVNGQICSTPEGFLVMGEDTGQPSPPPGWGVFDQSGRQIGKLATTYYTGGAEPFGCAVDENGHLFTSEVGNQASGVGNGQLVQWFPPFDRYPGPAGAYPDTDELSANACKLATDLTTAGAIAVDREGRVYVTSSRTFEVTRFSPPFPTGPDAAGGCGRTDALGTPLADVVNREVILSADPEHGMLTYSGLALAPNGNLYAASVITGRIAEYTTDGEFVRMIVDPPEPIFPTSYGTPQGITVGPDGTVYYADLDLRQSPSGNIGPGPNGKAWRVRFDDAGNPMTPEMVRDRLAFPDGVRVIPGNLQASESRTLAGGPLRQFFRHDDPLMTAAAARRLRVKWRVPTGAIITGSPAVATVDLPESGPTQAVFFTSWDHTIRAVRLSDGSPLWTLPVEDSPGATFPAAASVTVHDIAGRPHVLVGVGQWFYAIDAANGTQRWKFTAGTGCRDQSDGTPPGLCGLTGERNGIESTAIVTNDGTVVFGMDVNDRTGGKGGVYGLDLNDGRMRWFFDLESGMTCRPTGYEIRRYDGYHSAEDLGLPVDFFLAAPGCNHPRSPNGCGNVWSSPAYDAGRGLLFLASSNCESDDDPETPEPTPIMPPYDEAIFALRTDGSAAWRWRVRDVDLEDLAYGAVPNLFSIDRPGGPIDVVGIGNKDGSYTVLDRDGVNEENGVAWDDPAAKTDLPYWRTRVVQGGAAGGVLGTPAVDELNRRVHFVTGPGYNPLDPQRPTVHALDMDTGAILWQNTEAEGLAADSGFSPMSGSGEVVVAGQVQAGFLRVWDAASGELLYHQLVSDSPISGIATGAAIVDGHVLVGGGIGQRGRPGNPANDAALIPNSLVALCVSGAAGCPVIEPTAPDGVSATAGVRSAVVRWQAPEDDGGAGVTGYRVVSEPPGVDVEVGGEQSEVTVSGLTAGVAYRFQVIARNVGGDSELSTASEPVTPTGDTATCRGRTVTISGTDGPDVLVGTAGRDVISALGGDDLIVGLEGNDVICTGAGNDVVFGGAGVDRVSGGAGSDALVGGEGDDVLWGDTGADLLIGQAGNDAGYGGAGADVAIECETVRSAVVSAAARAGRRASRPARW